MSWTEEKILNLRALWGEGRTASQIASSLAVSRNAVIGKAHRLGLDARPSPIKGTVDVMARAAARQRPKKAPAEQRAPFGFSDRVCKWPIGDPRQPDFHFCGESAEGGLPYCAEHAAVAYQPARRHSQNDEARLAASLR